MSDAEGIASAILAARAAGSTIAVEAVPVDDAIAYEAQSLVTAARLSAGELVVGWKLGYTSAAMREALGVTEPNAGPLTDAMVHASPATLGAGLLQPRVEPEIAVLVGESWTVMGCLPALEVVDSVWTDYRFDWAHNTADGSSAAGAVLASEQVERDWLAAAIVTLSNSAGEESRGAVVDQLPDLAGVVTWLGAELESRGERLAAGSVVLTGGLLAPIALPAGGWARARFAAGGSSGPDIVVEARRPERTAS